MAGIKFSIALLLLSGMILFVGMLQSMGVKAWPQYCLDVEYMTCQSSGETKLSPRCNCCMAPKNCTLHLSDGVQIYCS